MSYRIIRQLFKNGRYIFQTICNRKYNSKILDFAKSPRDTISVKNSNERRALQQSLTHYDGIRTVGCQIGLHARKIFVDNVLNRVTNSLASDLRKRATKRLFYGDSGPFFALVGVSLASGSGLLTKDDELEGVCWEIREAVSKLRWNYSDPYNIPHEEINLQDLIIGPPIAKGCSAVVYSAKYKNSSLPQNNPETTQDDISSISIISSDEPETDSTNSQILSPFRLMRCRTNSFRNSAPNINFLQRRNSVEVLHDAEEKSENNEILESSLGENAENSFSILSSVEGSEIQSNGCSVLEVDELGSLSDYPIALKMMFNYDIQSCAAAIFKAMQRETLPARKKCRELESGSDLSVLPPHPNIVLMHSVFADRIPNRLPHASTLFPSALPQRINSEGYGRNMSLFLLMKRYDCSLNEYLGETKISVRASIILFAQLLEAIAHLSAHGIAHRDLKSDNILLELSDDTKTPPSLVISDFGCCLADPTRGFLLPYNSNEIDKGGNMALMAPEVITQSPGAFSVINYSKADLWSAGTIAYEIFGRRNPFYGKTNDTLRNTQYNEKDLPPLPQEVPTVIKCLVENILHRNPGKRLSPSTAATIMQLFLWAPSDWLKNSGLPSSTEILQWLLCLTTKILCEARLGFNVNGQHNSMNYEQSANSTVSSNGRRTLPEYVLISSFLARAKLHEIKKSLDWIHNI